MDYKDYYKILGVPKSADDKAIKTAYRRLARKHHPDVAKGKDSAARFQEIAEAYEVLGDAEKRKRYDTLGPDWQRYAEAGAGARGPFEGAEVHFGRGERGLLRLLPDDLRRRGWSPCGAAASATSTSEIWAASAGASGPTRAATSRRASRSRSRTPSTASPGPSRSSSTSPAPPAAERATSTASRARSAEAAGWSRGRRNLEVKIPAGVATGSRVRLPGEGSRGGRGGSGDLYLKVTVRPDPRFERKGDDLHSTLPVPAHDAALGTEVSVPTLKGQVSMKIPPETSSGRTFRLPGYGMPHLKGGGAGDQFVQVQLTIPTGLTPRERELYQELKNLRTEGTT